MPVQPDPRIPESFRKGQRKPVTTVGEVIAELQQLPPELRVLCGFELGVQITVTNFNDRYLAATFDEVEQEDLADAYVEEEDPEEALPVWADQTRQHARGLIAQGRLRLETLPAAPAVVTSPPTECTGLHWATCPRQAPQTPIAGNEVCLVDSDGQTVLRLRLGRTEAWVHIHGVRDFVYAGQHLSERLMLEPVASNYVRLRFSPEGLSEDV